jgi:hypothetical protein
MNVEWVNPVFNTIVAVALGIIGMLVRAGRLGLKGRTPRPRLVHGSNLIFLAGLIVLIIAIISAASATHTISARVVLVSQLLAAVAVVGLGVRACWLLSR